MNLLKKFAVISIFLITLVSYAQHPKIDSLNNVLKSATSVKDSIDTYNDLAAEYIYI